MATQYTYLSMLLYDACQKVFKLVGLPIYLSWQFDAVNDRVNQMVVLYFKDLKELKKLNFLIVMKWKIKRYRYREVLQPQ